MKQPFGEAPFMDTGWERTTERPGAPGAKVTKVEKPEKKAEAKAAPKAAAKARPVELCRSYRF